MHDTAGLTVSQKILLAAADLEARGFVPFTAAALTVAAWKIDAKTFGLRGFEAAHPDNNRVECCVMGERGLARRGWLVKVGQKLYQLSRQGKQEAERIRTGDGSEVSLPKRRALAVIQPSPECEAELNRLLVSRAVIRFRGGNAMTLGRDDADAFWSHGDGEAVEAVVAAARACLVGGVVRLRSGREVREAELAEVSRVNAWLSVKFAREVARRKAVGV
jgi:hypothetical protein